MGRFEMRVCSARNVANIQKIGIPDPYVKVSVLDGVTKKPSVYKTAVRKDDLAPVWNELFKFQISDPNKVQIKLELWNDNVLKDDLLGSYELSINGLEKGVVKDAWLILKQTKISTTELHVRLLAVDFGDPPSQGAKIVSSMDNDEFVSHAAVPNPAQPANVTVNCIYTPPTHVVNNNGYPAANYANNNKPVASHYNYNNNNNNNNNNNIPGVINMPLPPHLMPGGGGAPPPPMMNQGFQGPPMMNQGYGPPMNQGFQGPPMNQGYGPPMNQGFQGPPMMNQGFNGPHPGRGGYGPWGGGGGPQQAQGIPPGAY